MKMKNWVLVLLFVFTNSMPSFSQGVKSIQPGEYKGKFKVVMHDKTERGITKVLFTPDRYSCEGNDQRLPAGGSGTYTIKGNKILFFDENMWTADFDWNLILNGEYDFDYDGKKLKLITIRNGRRYEYDLKKKR
jgi:hypothetical protein